MLLGVRLGSGAHGAMYLLLQTYLVALMPWDVGHMGLWVLLTLLPLPHFEEHCLGLEFGPISQKL